MSIKTRAPSVTTLAPGTPDPSVTLMWAETPFGVLLASSRYTSTAPFSHVLTFAQSVQLALLWVGFARLAAPKVKLATRLRPIPPLQCLLPLHPSPRVRPLPPGFYQPRPPQGPPRYPCFLCSRKVSRNSLKCSICSKWVQLSCSSLTCADFRKICAVGSTIALLVSMGTLPLPPTSKHPPPRLSSSVPSHTPPTNTFRCNKLISTSTFTSSPP